MSHATRNDWELFVMKGGEPAVRETVLKSWSRARSAEVDPFSPPSLTADPPASGKQADASLFKGLREFMETAMAAQSTSPIAWLLCGTDGEVVDFDSPNPTFKEEVKTAGIVKGLRLDDFGAGTNAVAMAMFENKPAFCDGPEHYSKSFHQFSSSASPFFDIDGTLKGHVALFGRFPTIDGRFSLSLILMFIQALDRDLRLKRSKWVSNSLKSLINQLCGDDLRAMMIVNRNGYLRQINPPAIRLLDLEDAGFSEKSVDKIASFEPSIREIAKSAIRRKDSDMTIRLTDRTLRVSYDKTPLFNERDEFIGVLVTLQEKSALANQAQTTVSEAKYTFDDIIGKTPAITMAKELASRAAGTSVNVLLTGLSGTGKEMFAQSIHNASDRGRHPFISINCAAIPREIAESELFGYGSGAFTGAVKEGKIGKLEAANRGTVFLDEIGDMPFDLQSKLLRVLEERTITRVGESKTIPVDIRFIAATNKDIQELIREDQFREDLYYRLGVTSIRLPSLSDSSDDIPELTGNFIEYFNELMGKRVRGVKEQIMEKFKTYAWPGNIRELRNAIEFAVMMNTGEEWITWKDLPGQLRMELLYAPPGEARVHDPLYQERREVENSEKTLYERAVAMAGGNMSEAARILNVGRATLYRKLKKFDIKR